MSIGPKTPCFSVSSSSALAPRSPPKIDVHTHILPPHLPDLNKRYGSNTFITLEHCAGKCKMYKGNQFFRLVEQNCLYPESRLKEMDSQNVTVQVLSTVPVMFNYSAKPEHCLDLSMLLNDHIASIFRKNPRRFVGLATVPLQHPEYAIRELRRCKNLGFVGIQIGSHVNEFPLSDDSLFDVFKECETLDMCIFVHPWSEKWGTKGEIMQKYWLPWLVSMPAETSFAICSFIFSTLFDKLPRLRVCFAHGGGAFPGTIGRIGHGYECRPDLVAVDGARHPREYLGMFWLDSLVHDAEALKTIVRLVGDSKVCLGTDYPFPLGEAVAGTLIEQCDENALSEEQKLKLLWKNGLEFLGLEKWEDFFLGNTDTMPEIPQIELGKEGKDKENEDLQRLAEQVEKMKIENGMII